jgi:PAS domain S-box-containing protein
MSRRVVEVLCFEDNPSDSFLIREHLRETTVEEFVVTPAVRLRDGLTCLQTKAFDVILLDLGLPDSQGLETFRGVYERTQGTPIVVLSGLSDETVALRTLQEGAQDYLVKGEIGENVLIRSIRYAIERQRVQQELDRAHAENALILDSIPNFLIGVDQAGCIFRWNHLAEATFGLKSEEVVGQPLEQCPIEWNQEELSALIAACRDSAPTKSEISIRTRESKNAILGITLNAIRSKNGEQAGFLLIGSDISERKLLEDQLRQAQKMESVGRLSAGIAHQINSPMQFVSDNAHFLDKSFSTLSRVLETHRQSLAIEKELKLDYLLAEVPTAFRELRDGIERIRQIITAMKVFSHPGTTKKTVDINEAIQSTVVIARNEWKYAADVVTDFDSNLPAVSCFAGEFNQVILNLIVNAAHAIAEANAAQRKDKGTIKIGTRRDGGWIEIRISDTGTGIPEDVRHRIFDPFFTTKEVGKGTGQGLALAYAVIVEKHGGTIEVETEVGAGSTFIVRLPLEEKTSELTEATS